MRCLSLLVILTACAPRLEVGVPCVRASDCPEPLVCLLGRCRSECQTYRDCEGGEMCLLDETSGNRACRAPIERTCGEPCGELECVAGACVQTCTRTEDCGGTLCVSVTDMEQRVCVEPTGDTCSDGDGCAFGVCEAGYCDPVRSLAAGGENTCVLFESGRIACTGRNETSLLNGPGPFVTSFTPVTDALGAQPPFETLDLGAGHACALAAGEVRCWGLGGSGQNAAAGNVPPIPPALASLNGIIEVTTAGSVSCARTAADVYCWGSDIFGQLGDRAVHMPLLSRAAPARVELPVEAGRPLDIDTGGFHACAVVRDGRVYCWGANEFDQISPGVHDVCPNGPRDVDCTHAPIRVAGFGPDERVAVEVALGQSHTCVRTATGEVHCLGRNLSGELGNGMLVHHVSDPVRVTLPAVEAIGSGENFTCALLADARFACWGNNMRGELGTAGGGGGAPAFVEVPMGVRTFAVGFNHACAVSSNGGVYCWGDAVSARLGEMSDVAPPSRDPVRVPTRVRMGSMGF